MAIDYIYKHVQLQAQNVTQPRYFYLEKIITLTVEKYRTEPWSTSVNKKTLPK
jgi:hypothetical protein